MNIPSERIPRKLFHFSQTALVNASVNSSILKQLHINLTGAINNYSLIVIKQHK